MWHPQCHLINFRIVSNVSMGATVNQKYMEPVKWHFVNFSVVWFCICDGEGPRLRHYKTMSYWNKQCDNLLLFQNGGKIVWL